jgi:hypothetical protein
MHISSERMLPWVRADVQAEEFVSSEGPGFSAIREHLLVRLQSGGSAEGRRLQLVHRRADVRLDDGNSQSKKCEKIC